ncbi:hypothetical protein INH39_12545 [Massilia violaceinigra]|uniref:Uncharacterized protein n=1 Tax=Massilia violaceinigra TaxID=2045208 RepID=A0ABY4AC79_9BURK|nr:hypothetical protein [Massilia violaceinigra]UOD32405.1 hypothetical protein INH39_12545 [Massilia violaceinigra]
MQETPPNPAVPLQGRAGSSPSSACWRDGKLIVIPAGASLPARCVKCNAPAQMGKPQKFSWHDPKWNPLISIHFLLHIVGAAALQESVRLAVGLCERHRRWPRWFNYLSYVLIALGCATLAAAFFVEESLLTGSLAFAIWLVAAIIGSAAGHTLTAAYVSKAEARLKGGGSAFLDSLPRR